jgi:pyruvate dehydrogenase E1 component alpha subunit
MILIRRFDELALEARLQEQVFGTMHPYIGQEAIAVGICSALDATDRLVSNHRGHGHCIAKGADPKRMMAELFGRSSGYCRGKGGSMHIADFEVGMLGANGIVGAGMPLAAGSALAALLEGSDRVTVAFFGDGATGQGVFHEALNFSSIWHLPVVWVCENNNYADGSRLDEMLSTTEVSRLAAGHGIAAAAVNGNDLLAVAQAAREAVSRARTGGGATFIEAKTYRWGVHSQRGVRLAEKRPQAEVDAWRARDPIAEFDRVMLAAGAIDAKARASIVAGVDATLQEAVAFAESSPFPSPEDALTDLWAEMSE